MGKLRIHQKKFGRICQEFQKDGSLKFILASVTPGGGKSLLPVIAASTLVPHRAQKICWVVPRLSLQRQAEEAFTDILGRDILGHNNRIRTSCNDINPCRDNIGFSTTYQAIGTGHPAIYEEFKHRDYILVLDEPHHIEEDGSWHKTIEPLVLMAKVVVLMSGTLERGNNSKISFLNYRDTDFGPVVDLRDSHNTRAISYTRSDALKDEATIPVHFKHLEGEAKWIDKEGESQQAKLSESDDRANEALYTVLNTEFAYQLLDRSLAHWQDWRTHQVGAKYLVVAPNIKLAKEYTKHIRGKGLVCDIATSNDSQEAINNIKKFKYSNLDILVTVGMAYEGLDVKAITHIACLTNIRSKPWIEQMLARATRYNPAFGTWGKQSAFVFCPDDPMMQNLMEMIESEQISIAKEKVEQIEIEGEQVAIEKAFGGRNGSLIIPVDGQAQGFRQSILGIAGLEMSDLGDVGIVEPDNDQLTLFMSQNGLEGSAEAFRKTVENLAKTMTGNSGKNAGNTAEPPKHGSSNQFDFDAQGREKTQSEQEEDLRKNIDRVCRVLDASIHKSKWGTMNTKISKTFGKKRKEMTLSELKNLWVWLNNNFEV